MSRRVRPALIHNHIDPGAFLSNMTTGLVGRLAGALAIVAASGVAIAQSHAAPSPPLVYSAEVDSVIQPVSAEYMIETMDRADRAGATLVVFTLRTPGGLVDSTRDIITHMLASKTPVGIFVGPSGARAASAGFLLTAILLPVQVAGVS